MIISTLVDDLNHVDNHDQANDDIGDDDDKQKA